MDELELTTFIRYKDDSAMEFIEHVRDVYSEEILDEMQEKMEVIEYTILELKKSNAFSENIKELYGEIARLREIEGETDVLDEFSVSFE